MSSNDRADNRKDHETFKLGIVGIAGYARMITELLMSHGGSLEPKIRIAAASGPEAVSDSTRVQWLESQGISVHETLDAMLDAVQLDAVWILTPIHLHCPMTLQCLKAGLHVMSEKPAAGSVTEVQAMIEQRDASARTTLIGFQDIYDTTVIDLKRRLLRGELGAIRRITLHGCWPRDDVYFNRNNWAGRLYAGDRPVFDSPLNNAMSHFAHQCLFFAGKAMNENARIEQISVELYRAAKIASFDTVCLHGQTDTGPEISIGLTHAASDARPPIIRIETERGKVIRRGEAVEYQLHGQAPVTEKPPRDKRLLMAEHFARCCLGRDVGDAPGGRLEMALQHTRLIEMVHAATPIHDVPLDQITYDALNEGGTVAAIPGIEDALQQAVDQACAIHALQKFSWTQPAGQKSVTDGC